MKVIKRALVKQVLTEKSKEALLEKFTSEKKRLLTECEQLNFEKKKTLKYNELGTHAYIKDRYSEEIKQRQEKVQSSQFKIDQLQKLPLGTEVIETEIETILDLSVGDDWQKAISPAVIVVKDGKIVALRS